MNKKRFIAQQGGPNTIRVFNAETGQLYRVITVSGQISSPPICSETEMYVGVKTDSGQQVVQYYNVPSFNLKRTTSI